MLIVSDDLLPFIARDKDGLEQDEDDSRPYVVHWRAIIVARGADERKKERALGTFEMTDAL